MKRTTDRFPLGVLLLAALSILGAGLAHAQGSITTVGFVTPSPPLPTNGTLPGPITVAPPTFTVIGGVAFGALTISGGATLKSGGNANVADGPGSGTVTVDGPGSTWIVGDAHGDFPLWVGRAGPGIGTLTISNQGKVILPQSRDPFSGDTNVGYTSSGVGVLNVTSGGTLEGRGLLVGSQGHGTLNISDGGTVVLQQITVIGRFQGGNGTINVNSAGTLTVGPILSYNFENGSDPTAPFVGGLIVGDALNGGGTGTLNINGGVVVSQQGTVVGKFTGGVGTVNVDSGGTLESTDTIVIGDEGKGTLTIQNGLVQTGGTIVVNNGNTANVDTINAVDGTIETSGGITILGLGQVSLNHSTLTATAGDALLVENGGDATISISNVNNTITASTGNLLRGIGGAKAALTVDASTITGNILADSASTVDVNLLDNSTLTAVIQGAHNLFIDPSTWIMPNDSFITGNLTLLGNLIVNSVAKFAATGEASVLTIGGNLVMGSGSSTSLGIGGLNGEQYDRLVVGGSASVSGKLIVNSLGGFHPSPGEAFGILRTGGTRSGNWGVLDESNFNTLAATPPGQLRPVAIEVLAPNGVDLVYAKATTSPPPGPTPPIIEVDPEPLPPVNPEEPTLPPEIVSILDPTAEQLTSMFEIGFSGANSQRFNLDDRMLQIQQTIAPPPPAPAPYVEKGAEGKAPPPPAYQPGPCWGVWANGWGDFVNVYNDTEAKGYRFTTGGMSAGIDYRITDHLAVGLFGGYSHTWTDLRPGSIDVDTGRGGLYGTYFDPIGWWVNVGVWGGYNSYSTSRQAILGPANESTNGYEVSTFGDAGYDIHCGNLTFGPIVAMQYTTVHIDSFSEHGSVVPLNVHSDSEDSLRTDAGARISYTWHAGKIVVIPQLELDWEHEFKYSNLPITVSAPTLGGPTATFTGPNLGHDSLIINAGIGAQISPQLSVYIGYQGQQFRGDYAANAVTGTFSFRFRLVLWPEMAMVTAATVAGDQT